MRIDIPVSGPSKQDRAIQCSSQRSINMYAALKPDGDSKSPLVMYAHPGLLRTSSVGLGPFRSNAIKWKGDNYWISGSDVFKQTTSSVFTSIGSVLTSGSRIIFAKGRDYLMLVDGSYGYYTSGSSVTRITDADFSTSPTFVEYLDGYFIVNNSTNDDFYINETLEDPTSWLALDFSKANANPDKGVGLATYGKDLYIPGEETTQLFFNSGNSDFPFEPYPGAMQIGIDAAYSLAKSPYGLIWLSAHESGDKSVVMAHGNQYQSISNQEWDDQINQLASTSDAIAWVRRQSGLSFYEITFPSSERSWSYCLESKMLGELKTYGINRFCGNGFGYFNGKSYIGDFRNGLLYELDRDTYTDDSNSFIRTRRTRIFHEKGLSMTFRSLILDVESGVGLITGQGSDPQVMMRYSTDGGRTWSSELWSSLGELGNPEAKPQWINLGMGYDWVFEFSCSDPVKFNLFNLFADIDIGRS